MGRTVMRPQWVKRMLPIVADYILKHIVMKENSHILILSSIPLWLIGNKSTTI